MRHRRSQVASIKVHRLSQNGPGWCGVHHHSRSVVHRSWIPGAGSLAGLREMFRTMNQILQAPDAEAILMTYLHLQDIPEEDQEQNL